MFRGTVTTESALTWSLEGTDGYDVAVGNPPFVRFQFVSPADRVAADRLSLLSGISMNGVSNLWIPVLLAALRRLRRGGAFAFVVPTEIVTGASAGRIRKWLLDTTSDLRLDLLPAGSFPGALQEVAVLSGRMSPSARPNLTIRQYRSDGYREDRTVDAASEEIAWTRYLLGERHREAIGILDGVSQFEALGAIARFEVSIVTGANDFFTLSDLQVRTSELRAWAEPLLARIRNAPGLVYTREDHEAARSAGAAAWILNFEASRPDPEDFSAAAHYLRHGERLGLDQRYKCRIRRPWYRVPNFQKGALMMSKRSHLFPRMVVNRAAVYTTDTIYRGRLLNGAPTPEALASAFHNSATLLSAELEGRSFGGGVLELVPSEVARLRVPVVPEAAGWLESLDAAARDAGEEGLVGATDDLLVAAGVIDPDVLFELSDARRLLQDRRMERNRAGRTPVDMQASLLDTKPEGSVPIAIEDHR